MSVTDTFSIAQRFFIDNKHLLPGCLPVTQVNEKKKTINAGDNRRDGFYD